MSAPFRRSSGVPNVIHIFMAVLALLLGISVVLPLLIPRTPAVIELTINDLAWFGAADNAFQTIAVKESESLARIIERRDDDPEWWRDLSICFGVVAASASSWGNMPLPDNLGDLARSFDHWVESIGHAANVCQDETLSNSLHTCIREIKNADTAIRPLLDAMPALRVAIRDGHVHVIPDGAQESPSKVDSD